MRVVRKSKPLDVKTHLSDEELLPYARQQLENHRQHEAIQHVSGCARCSLKVYQTKKKHNIYPYDG